ncbi:MAG: flagellar basal body rod protein FlgB [Clostridia bacterium]|nr:flagellar basal body rod protein FlgB [Clostridia bacterium]MCI1999905.1 flagellar basal body rod protein FlgB [Clostridia bacterium]MCI2014179.1 flagellar basal body rod protein FlgB [Clostridia bacterium]
MFDNALFATEKLANYLWQKQKVTLNNIANVSTPGYKAQYVTFQDELKKRLEFDDNESSAQIKNDIGSTDMHVYTKEDESNRLDGNNVNMDAEQVELASTTIQYQMAIDSISDEISRIRSAMK